METGMLFAGRYLVEKKLGEGGFGETYLAIDTHSPARNKVVIKKLLQQKDPGIASIIKEKFAKEAAVLEQLGKEFDSIPNLVAYLQDNDSFYLVQEFINGHNLEEISKYPWDKKRVIWFLESALDILEQIQSKKIIHRDIKLSNFIFANNKLYLIDFGAVKEIIDGVTSINQTVIIGTPGFMSPEQQKGNPNFSSDIYGLGITALCLLTAKTPSEFPINKDEGVIDVDRILINSNEPKLTSILAKSLARSSRDRYQNATEMKTDLQIVTRIQSKDSCISGVPATEVVENIKVGNTYPNLVANDTDSEKNFVHNSYQKKREFHFGYFFLIGSLLLTPCYLLFNLIKDYYSVSEIPEDCLDTNDKENCSIEPSPLVADKNSNSEPNVTFDLVQRVDVSKRISLKVPSTWEFKSSNVIDDKNQSSQIRFTSAQNIDKFLDSTESTGLQIAIYNKPVGFQNYSNSCKDPKIFEKNSLSEGVTSSNTEIYKNCGDSSAEIRTTIIARENPTSRENEYIELVTQTTLEKDWILMGEIFKSIQIE
jgi:serine/threonine protein kinase